MVQATEPYDDDYDPCAETFATLRIFSGEAHPQTVTDCLGIQPSRITLEATAPYRRANTWFLTSEGVVKSRDFRRHIDWMLGQLLPACAAIEELKKGGAICNFHCYWVMSRTNGYLVLSQNQMSGLAALGIEIWWDIYSPWPKELGDNA
jgi:Domain of unknown function (DUF4279)